jgi:hypothetical protein
MPATPVRLALIALAYSAATPAGAQLLERKELSYPIALTIAQAALEDCKARGYATSVVVVDRGGNTVVSLRADNASVHTMENARRNDHAACKQPPCTCSCRPSTHSFRASPQRGGRYPDQISIGSTRGPRFSATKVSATPPRVSACP